ncbi:MAG: SIMPL domain-containing protein [Anaerolineales bacterium]|nr:SIMPL domain-containing protein [Anaerolineales bacterium]
MKQTSTVLNAIMVCTMVLMMVTLVLPNVSVKAAPTAEATFGTTGEPELVCDTGRLIQVSGTAVVNVIPDRVLIQLGVQSNGTTPQKVEVANSTTINKIIRALKVLGIEEKDIVTDWYVIQPLYDEYDSLYIKGYRIHNIVAVTLRDISKVNKVIGAALDAGANQVVEVEFYLSDLRKYRDQARDLAMKAAKEKANDLASAAGAETGCVMNINENSWSYYNGGWYGQSRELWTQNVVQNAAPAGGESGVLTDAGPVNLGQISVRAEVSASFSLR